MLSVASAQEPGNDYQRPEAGVDRGENPRLGLVKEDLVQPVFDKSLGIAGLPGPAPQFIFPDGQWAEPPEPRLQDDETNRRQVCYSEINIMYPRPVRQQADQYQQEAEDDKYNKCEVNDEYRCCQHAI